MNVSILPLGVAFLEITPLAEFDVSGRVFGLIMALAGMGFGLTMAVMGMRHEAEKRRQRNELIRVALEKGQPVPPAVLGESSNDDALSSHDPERSIRNARKSGIIMIFVSVGMVAFFLGMNMGQIAWVAAFPAAVGLAQLVNAQMDAAELRRKPRTPSNPHDPKSGSAL